MSIAWLCVGGFGVCAIRALRRSLRDSAFPAGAWERAGAWFAVRVIFFVVAGSAGATQPAHVTHGPLLGRPGADSMGVWVRTSRPSAFRIRYGLDPGRLDQESKKASTEVAHDNAAWVELTDLKPGAVYYYEAFVPDGLLPTDEHRGTFRTLPDRASFVDAETNPLGWYNYSFEIACGNSQSQGSDRVELPTYRTMVDRLAREVDFALLNGDWLYEERRDWPVARWQSESGAAELPSVVQTAPAIVGAWENYKLYWQRAASLRAWHRQVPSYFMFDDHEIVDDVAGSGEIGCQNRRALFRDVGLQAWHDYLGWSNPVEPTPAIHFGRARLSAGSDVLVDEQADFSTLRLERMDNLHVHFGGPSAGLKGIRFDHAPGAPNAGVYEIVERLDRHRLRIRPPARSDAASSYSIGSQWYFQKRMANSAIYVLDTRSHRQTPNLDHPTGAGRSILGARQKEWLKKSMQASDAAFLFVVSSVNLMVPHMVDVGQDDFVGYDDAWTAFVEERDEMVQFWDGLGKPVILLTGDLHNSFVAKVTDRVWEFAAGPHNSGNARAASEGDRPANGPFTWRGRTCDIRWSTYGRNDASSYRQRVYCVVQVNNVFQNPSRENPSRWVAFPQPQVVVHYYDGDAGKLLYAESIVARSSGS